MPLIAEGLFLSLAAVATGTAAAAVPAALPCAPPLGQPLRLLMTQDFWLADGRPGHVTVERELLFGRDAGGNRVDVRLIRLVPDPADPLAARRLRAALGPLDAPPLRIRLDATMSLSGVDDLEGRWRDFLDRQAALRRAMAAEGRDDDRAARLDARLATFGTAERMNLLAGFLAPVVRWCGARLPADARRLDDGAIALREDRSSGPTGASDLYALDPATGLLRTLERQVTAADAPLRPLRERWTLAAAPDR